MCISQEIVDDKKKDSSADGLASLAAQATPFHAGMTPFGAGMDTPGYFGSETPAGSATPGRNTPGYDPWKHMVN